ncbi:hypothetical protein ILUMI_09188 [Ignelater luminosus]|uniref:Uncharacterized protein n=1 Tax=Ignelater luminosus TaxID=2038154 RepID=A0A8K0D4C3_IGNLU|nr:hypothetical protein ILUMI_09188 [Ignelater luminosus]
MGDSHLECAKDKGRMLTVKQFENLCKDEEESESLCFSATTNYESESSISYFLDSGATEHLVCTKVLLSNVRKLKTPIAKSGTHIEANQVGDIDIVSERDDMPKDMLGKKCGD